MVRLYKKYLKGFRKEVFLGPMFKLTEAIFELIVPLVMAKIIDVGIANGDSVYVMQMGGIMILLGVVGLGCAFTCQYFAAKASQGFGTIVRNDLFAHINTLSHAEIDKIGTPSLITRMTNDVNQLQQGVAMLIRLVVRAPFLVIGAVIMAFMLDWKLACIFLVTSPLIALVLYIIMSKSIPFYRKIQKQLDNISLITRENLTGVRVIRAFSKQEKEVERFEAASDTQMGTSVTVGKISALLNPITSVIINLAIVAVIWFGGMRVDTGALTQGEVIAFVNYLNQILLAMIVVANLVVLFTKASASGTRVNEVFDTKTSLHDSGSQPVKASKKSDQPKIELKDVSFSYQNSGENSLTDVSIKIYPGQTIGIIGGTGSGKSTLVNLIPRFYDVSSGSVLIDGVDVRQYPLEQLRQQIGIVPQRAVLFSGTIRKNMQWKKTDASDTLIQQALSIAQAKEFVDKLPDGLDTDIMQGGKNLSGGQKQRLTIARALVGEPRILILDDSSSALDFATDSALRRAITQEIQDVTILMVSQRATSIQHADQIIVLDDGHVAGIGTHETLFAECSVYREICLSQLNADEANKGVK